MSGLLVCLNNRPDTSPGEEDHIDPRSAYERREQVEFIDVREPYEWEAGHIEGALHIPLEQVPARLGELDEDVSFVAVCRVGQRSDYVAGFLRARGFDVENLDGGMQAWARAQLPFVAADGGPGRVV